MVATERAKTQPGETKSCHSPSGKARDVIIAVKDLQVVGQAGHVILYVKLQEVEADSLAVSHTNVPVADLLILIFVRVTRGMYDLLLICQNSTTLLCCVTESVEVREGCGKRSGRKTIKKLLVL